MQNLRSIYLILICPVSSTRSTLEHPNRQEQENTQRLAGTANMTRKRLRVSSIENLEHYHLEIRYRFRKKSRHLVVTNLP